MTLPDVERLFAYWKKHPPLVDVATAIAMGFGYKPPDQVAAENEQISPEEFLRMINATGGQLGLPIGPR